MNENAGEHVEDIDAVDDDGYDGRDGDYPRRRRWPPYSALLLALALTITWGVRHALAPGFPESDPRACPGSTVPLQEAARRVGLILPGAAQRLSYRTGGSPVTLSVAFSIDTTHLQQWLNANNLPAPALPDGQEGTSGPECAAQQDGFSDPVTTSTTLPGGSSLRASIDTNHFDFDGTGEHRISGPAVLLDVESR